MDVVSTGQAVKTELVCNTVRNSRVYMKQKMSQGVAAMDPTQMVNGAQTQSATEAADNGRHLNPQCPLLRQVSAVQRCCQ